MAFAVSIFFLELEPYGYFEMAVVIGISCLYFGVCISKGARFVYSRLWIVTVPFGQVVFLELQECGEGAHERLQFVAV